MKFFDLLQLGRTYLRVSLRVKTWLKYGYKHKAEINPFRVLWINPNQIITAHGVVIPNKDLFCCHILDGDWDLTEERFEDLYQYNMLQEHFKYGFPWSDTSIYHTILSNIIKKGISWYGCRSEIDVLARCEQLDRLFDAIKNSGYLIPDGLKYGETGLTKTSVPLEVAVNIGRDGRIIFWDGLHRLSIAKILGLPLIPVRVVVRHKNWQDLRDRIVVGRRKNNLPEYPQYQISHPDILYLIG